MQLHITEKAEEDIEKIKDWYSSEREDLDKIFMQYLKSAFSRILRTPRSGSEFIPGVRKVLLKKFPYCVYYSIVGDDVGILAVYHVKRDRTRLLKRFRS